MLFSIKGTSPIHFQPRLDFVGPTEGVWLYCKKATMLSTFVALKDAATLTGPELQGKCLELAKVWVETRIRQLARAAPPTKPGEATELAILLHCLGWPSTCISWQDDGQKACRLELKINIEIAASAAESANAALN